MTIQISERLILDGKYAEMMFWPPLPVKHARICEAKIDEDATDGPNIVFRTTACWRRYQGTWEIRKGRFYLVGLRGRLQIVGDEAIIADWCSGFLLVPTGGVIEYRSLGFNSFYEEVLLIKIERGVVVTTSLPTSLPVGSALGFQSEHEIGSPLKPDPNRLRSGETVTLAVEEAAETGDHANHLIERWRGLGWRLALGHQIDRLPFGPIEDDIARHLGTVASEHGEQQHAPGDDHVERQCRLETFALLQLQFFDTTAAFEDSEKNLDTPSRKPP